MNESDDRIQHAMELAEKCWNKALSKSPSFVQSYFECANDLLLIRPLVTGDEFREFCANNRVFLPETLHHNTWVSGVNALKEIGWIKPIGKSEPTKSHNHMDTVTVWKSLIFGGKVVFKRNEPQGDLF